jgi:tetratricopeptide (TPR) repeat protein/TolB-like protein
VGAAAVAWVFLSSGGVTSRPAISEGTVPIVVVLPVAVGGSVSPDYGDLARALTAELTNRLGEVPGLLVVPQETVQPHLRETQDPVEVGRRLRGDAVVESSLNWTSSGVETSSRVTDVLTGQTLWDASHRYPHTEILNAHLDLTVGLASALNVRMATLPARDLTFSSDAELQAWSLVSLARDTSALRPLPAERAEAAKDLIQKAFALDADYAPAYATLSLLYLRLWNTHRDEPRWVDSMVAAAERAVALDPDHFASQLSLAQAMRNAALAHPERYPPELLRRGAEAALRAVQLNPGSPEASYVMFPFWTGEAGGLGRVFLWMERAAYLNMNWLAVQHRRTYYFWLLGEYEAAIEAHRLATELDPRRPHPEAFRVPEYNLSRGRLKEARRQIEAVRARDPENVMAFPILIYLEFMEGNYEAAEELIENLLDRDPPIEHIDTSNFHTRSALGYVYLKTGRVREGKRLLEVVRDDYLEHILAGGSGYAGHYNLARMYALLEEPEQAVYWLGVAIDRGWPFYYTELGPTNPMLENLVGNEDFESLMADLKAELDAEREWVREMLALPEPERFHAMLIDAETRLELLWEAQAAGG